MGGNQQDEQRRRPRADAQRNRLLLLETAQSLFAAKGADASMDEIARAAGVGPGTLYRHFPNRDALIEAVYRNEMQQLAEAADRLSQDLSPVEALRSWMQLFIGHMATKQMMAVALQSLPSGPAALYEDSGVLLRAAIAMLTGNAVRSGDIDLKIEPLELLRAIAAVASAGAGADWERNATHLVDILIAGMQIRR